MPDSEIVTLRLPRDFVGQLVDCLQVTIESWEDTKLFLDEGNIDRDDACIRECSSSDEAREIAIFYRRILADVRDQAQPQPAG